MAKPHEEKSVKMLLWLLSKWWWKLCNWKLNWKYWKLKQALH